MSLQDSLFAEEVEDDVTLFAQLQTRKRVLVFPPVNNYRRFLIHQIIQERFNELKTFSIGQDFARRTVVCFKSDVLRDPKLNVVQGFWSKDSSDKISRMGVEDRRSPSASPENTRNRQVKSAAPAVEIYRPPAARRGQLSSSTTSPIAEQSPASKANRQRRPDRAVYVPKHRRSNDPEGSPQHQEDSPALKPERKSRSSITASEIPCDDSKIQLENIETVEVPKKVEPVTLKAMKIIPPTDFPSVNEVKEKTIIESPLTKNDSVEINDKISDDNDDYDSNNSKVMTNGNSDSLMEFCVTENISEVIQNDEKINIEVEKIIKHSDVSSVLIISDLDVEKNIEPKKSEDELSITVRPPEKKPKKVSRAKSKPASPPSPPIKLNRDECDWDSLFDDNGECLDPTLIEELTAAVGDVTIEQPKNDYKPFTRPVEVSTDEFAHVVEIYNFPSEYKTSDLATVFSPFRNGGFELKWVDDTHCLGVFSSPLVAAEVLASDHPFVKTRPLNEATTLSKTKARKSAETLQPYRTRPETCAALARRLVTGALGVRLATARQEREQEKIVLREAKERKRLANKQRDDAWEGIITPK